MAKFWELLRESVIVQGLLALGTLAAVLYLVVAGRAVPDLLLQVLFLILGFYFGSKTQRGAKSD